MNTTLIDLVADIHDHWRAGASYGFPACCRARFLASSVVGRTLSAMPLRRLRSLAPRHAAADGFVMCEYHLAKWVMTGRKPVTDERRNTSGTCCDHRMVMEREGIATITVETIHDYAGKLDAEPVTYHALRAGPDAEPVHVFLCPWCGTQLDGG